MQFMSTWKDPSGELLVYFAPQVIAVFNRYIQGEHDAEAGGILLGHVRGIHLEILEATVPTPKDRRLKYFFERLLHGHQGIAERRWRDSDGLVRYVGEWHTHPEDHPMPSGLDINEWGEMVDQCWQRLLDGQVCGRSTCMLMEQDYGCVH
ncbi:Mov34/MPN/PAD-1 family protein [Pseudomonas syringae group genomosp. 3]|uniref:Mov34/MPN/PAD-1 family protein n=1 Tax=Pseudomonas syringae group genomosp. 3 TaxID=251701 RepID=UPI000AB79A11|nr:Mov34/MPN/PAD-1 family protein [Pseudomonas syringae group genomosp. 3]